MAVTVDFFNDLDAVAADAAGALDREAQPLIYHRLDWFARTLRHCPPPGRLLVARARDEATAARSWLFLMVDRGEARLLASWYSLVAGFADAPPWPCSETRGAILAALARRRPQIDRLHLTLGAEEPEPPAPDWRAALSDGPVNWTMNVDGLDWDSYWSARPGQLRSTVDRKTRKAPIETRIHQDFDESAWADYEAVYAASWKPVEGSMPFLRDLVVAEATAGTLRLGIGRQEGCAVAAQLWLVEAGRATIHKLAHREDAKARSPGTLLSAAMFREVIERDRPCVIDFGTGDDGYKRDWVDQAEQRRTLTLYNRHTLCGRALWRLRQAKMLVAGGLRR